MSNDNGQSYTTMAPVAEMLANLTQLVTVGFKQIDQRFEDQERKMMTLFDLTHREIKRLDTRIDSVEVRLNRLEAKVDHLEVRFDKLEARVDAIDLRLTSLEMKVDRLQTDVTAILHHLTSK